MASCANYLRKNERELFYDKDKARHYHHSMFHGYDMDTTMLRIGAMNMMLHRVEDPQIAYRDSLSRDNTDRGVYNLILANPPFKGSLDSESVAPDLLANIKTKKTELLFVQLILEMLQIGGRAVVIVPDGVLFGSSKAHKNLRKELVEHHRLQGVISMPSGVFKPYAGVSTGILLFTKTGIGGTEDVWFYDMTADGYSLNDNRSPVEENDIPDIIQCFKTMEDQKDKPRTGKTRTAASIVDMMMGANRATRILFLADRVALVKQAMRTFGQLLLDLSIASVGEGKTRPEELATARMLFSTYPAMINAMDRMRLEGKERFFTVGYFDLIIIDEAHRSIYERYKTIFDYFDAKIVGLTATPREDLDRNTYDIFGLEVGDPTFYYEMGEAVKSGYLVDYRTREVKLKFPEEGIHYDQLSPEEQARFEKLFAVEAGEDTVPGSAINKWFFNVNTVDIVINELMERGVRDGTGNEIGKTIIFAANQRHAELIKERFDVLYPEKGSDYADVITHAVQYAQDLIDRFSVKEKMPRIAISVNMLDTGIDVPEVVNLVFFKKVLSKTMFWQMVGRGTRLCPDLFGPGEDKDSFLILDYGSNMERFSVPSKPSTETITRSLTERIYMAKAHLIYALEAGPFKGEEYSRWRGALVDEWKAAIGKLNTELVAVREQLNYVYYFGNEAAWKGMSRGDLSTLEDRLAPHIHAITDDEKIQRFDLAMYTLAGARALGESDDRTVEKVRAWALALLEKQRDLPAIEARAFELNQLASEDFWVHATPLMIEEMRAELRHLMPLLPARPATRSKFGDFTDDVLTVNEGGSISNVGQFENYRARVEEHIRSRVKDDAVLNKVYNNDPLSVEDMAHLESILWHDLGTKKEYDDTFGEKAILKLIREINGLSPEAVQRAFADFLNRYELSFD